MLANNLAVLFRLLTSDTLIWMIDGALIIGGTAIKLGLEVKLTWFELDRARHTSEIVLLGAVFLSQSLASFG